MTDIVERLRWRVDHSEVPICNEAADEIERLRAEREEELRKEYERGFADGLDTPMENPE